jgi:cell division protein FtsQ
VFNRPKNRRKQNERSWSLPEIDWRRWLVTTAAVVGICGALCGVVIALDPPIERVSAAGRFQRVSPVDVERAVRQQVRHAGLISVDLDAVRAAIKTLPWVDTVSVQREWPRGLHVIVVEQVAAARWGESGLLNTRGELFAYDARHVPLELAQLSGPEGTEHTVARRYLESQSRLAETGMRISALRLDERGAWEIDLTNGVTVRLGRRQVDERFDRFVTTAVKLVAQRADDIVYVDMRYTNGFAVGWRGSDEARTPPSLGYTAPRPARVGNPMGGALHG